MRSVPRGVRAADTRVFDWFVTSRDAVHPDRDRLVKRRSVLNVCCDDDAPENPPRGQFMNVVYLGVSAGLDSSSVSWTLGSFLVLLSSVTALMLPLAWNRIPRGDGLRFGVVRFV